jgi:hypothetical protein
MNRASQGRRHNAKCLQRHLKGAAHPLDRGNGVCIHGPWVRESIVQVGANGRDGIACRPANVAQHIPARSGGLLSPQPQRRLGAP